MRTIKTLERAAAWIESSESLDGPADALAGVIRKIVRPGVVEDTLSGVPSGHPLHPAIVAVPIGAWASAGLLDVLGDEDAARRLIAGGLIAALPALASGGSDWLSTAGAERRVGFVHALTNYVALGAYGLSWWARRRGAKPAGVALSIVGAGAVSAAGWLGGHLAYAQGVGVDVTAFQQFPPDWVDVGSESAVPGEGVVTVADAGGIPVLLTRVDNELIAMADRCTHRGAPLHEGEVADGCITCPWHDSVFSLADGAVVSGPAVYPQPVLETRLEGGRIEVRRRDERALRKNQTGV